ncbi:MAG: MOSC domain-containing protein [Planctomycetota bacterium]|nr:MAG: MOSC domain-containing protein [Planctomycetota bacterium]
MANKGRIKAISVSKQKGTRKVNVPEAQLRADFGIIGDAHAGKWHRQISLLAVESINRMVERGAKVSPGDFAENITTEGMDLLNLSIGDKLKVGESAQLEITQFGKKCHDRCEIFKRVGDCIMPREGVFTKVIKAGSVSVGDAIEVTDD